MTTGLVKQAFNEEETGFMGQALILAQKAASYGEVPIGAVIVRDGQIIAKGRNTRENRQDATGHAEIAAIRQACRALGSWRLCDCDLYVTLEPCLMCAGAIVQARIRHLYFGAYDPKSGMAGSVFNAFALPSNHRVEITGGVLEEPCGNLLRCFFTERRNGL
ncbi:MAG TPA: tRNA adenosine(34) deaminase TadA [Clostridia bacterium]|nr:tRNA adenosine(34) deaminase TadA [Clostridia bacterium]